MPRSGFKTSDPVQGQGVRPFRRRPSTSIGLWRDKSRKRSPPHILADAHLSEACNATIGP